MRFLLVASLSILGIAASTPGRAADPDPASLVKQLGSKRFPEREAAATALMALGREALPALRGARDGKDIEFQRRVTDLIRTIEGRELTRPTLVTLDFRDRPMSEVIREISGQTGFPLTIYERQVDWLSQKITLREPIPLPFWKAIDRICEAGDFQYNLASGQGGATVALFKNDRSGPSSDVGIFRVQIEAIYYKGRYQLLHLGRDQPSIPIYREEDRSNSHIRMRVMVEPRMLIRSAGKPKPFEIVDDLGQSLLATDPTIEQPDDDRRYSLWELVQVPLKRVDQPGKVIRKLRGIAPVSVAARRARSLDIPLADSVGRSFPSDEAILTIRGVREIVPNFKVTIGPDDQVQERERPEPRATEIELTLMPIDGRGITKDLSEDQFEILDADGRVWKPSPWWLSGTKPQTRDGETHIRLIPVDNNLSPWRGDFAEAKLRYYETIVLNVDVPFEFSNLFLP